MIDLAIARIPPPALGTAFAVNTRIALTAWHCISDPDDDSRASEHVELTFLDGQTVTGRFREGDQIEDWAILELDPPLAGNLQPIPLRREVPTLEECRCLGFPVSAAYADELGFQPVGAKVTGETRRAGARRISLSSMEAGLGLDARGISGGPLIPRSGPEEAVGIMCRRLLDARTRKSVGGVLFACPAHLIADRPLLSRPVFDRGVPDAFADAALVESARAGDLTAATEVGRRLRVNGDLEAAERWLRDAARAGSAPAAYELGLLLDPDGELIHRDRTRAEQALAWFRRAAVGGDLFGAATIGVRLRQHGREDASMPWLEDAAERGDLMAAHTLALNHEDRYARSGDPRDLERAEELHRFAAENGDPRAASFLGHLLERKGKREEAIKWLHRALPDEAAADTLERLGVDAG